MGSFIEEEMAKVNWPLGTEYIEFGKESLFKDIKFIQTAAVPDDVILIHPFVMHKILCNSADLNNGTVDIHIRKGK